MYKLNGGHKYSTSRPLEFGEYKSLVKFARRENRKFKRARRVERLCVYPVPGTGFGQLVLLY